MNWFKSLKWWQKILVSWLLLLIILDIFSSNKRTSPSSGKSAPPELIDKFKLEKEKNKKEMDLMTQAGARGLMTIKSQLKDPDSFKPEWVQVNKDGSMVCIKYRAKNSFGAYEVEFGAFYKETYSSNPTKCNKSAEDSSLFDVTSSALNYEHVYEKLSGK